MTGRRLTIVRRALAALIVLAGVTCVVLGATWRMIVPAHSFWSPAQAQEYTDASVALKSAATRPDRRASQTDDPQLQAAQARFDRIQAALERAIARRDGSGILIAIGGVALAICGVVLFLRVRTPPVDQTQ